MILRRITQHVKDQNWFAVALDFFIVVLGVFIGLQVSNWNSALGERRAERAALERLFHEAQDSYNILHQHVGRLERLNRLQREAVGFIDSDAPLPDEVLPLKIGINTLQQFPRPPISDVVFEELKSSGQMQLIRSDAIRGTVASFHVDVDWLHTLTDQFANTDRSYWELYWRHVLWRYNPESTTSDILLSTFDWDSMRADREFISVAIGELRNQVVILNASQDLRESAKRMCHDLADATGLICSDPETASARGSE